MDICEEKVVSRWTMRQEILDNLDKEELKDSAYPEDFMREIADSLVPVYNAELIDLACHYSGEEYWDIWLNNEFGGETPLDILRGNIFALYHNFAIEILREIEEEE